MVSVKDLRLVGVYNFTCVVNSMAVRSDAIVLNKVLEMSKEDLKKFAESQGVDVSGLTKKSHLLGKVLEGKEVMSSTNNNEVAEFKSKLHTYLPLLPIFKESEVEEFFQMFERISVSCGWPRRLWHLLLQHGLTGKARSVLLSIPLELCENYDTIKEQILCVYQRSPEYYRLKFRNENKLSDMTFTQFVALKSKDFENWKRAANVKTLEDLEQLILMENFQNFLSAYHKRHVSHSKNVVEMGRKMDEMELHEKTFPTATWKKSEVRSFSFKQPSDQNNGRTWMKNKYRQYEDVENPHYGKQEFVDDQDPIQMNGKFKKPQQRVNTGKDKYASNSKDDKESVSCTFCGRSGHYFSNCFKRKK